MNELKKYFNSYLNFLRFLMQINTSLVLNLVSHTTCLCLRETLWNFTCISQQCLQSKREVTFGTTC